MSSSIVMEGGKRRSLENVLLLRVILTDYKLGDSCPKEKETDEQAVITEEVATSSFFVSNFAFH